MMDLIINRVDVWAASFKDEPGGLATILSGLRNAGANLNFIIARRAPDKPGTGVVFVTPLYGDAEIAAASILGFNVTTSVQSVRIEGENRKGVVADLTTVLADAGIDLRGVSAAVYGPRFILYVSFDSVEDAQKAVEILRSYKGEIRTSEHVH